MRQMETLEFNQNKEQEQHNILLNIAHTTGQSIRELTAAAPRQPCVIPREAIFDCPRAADSGSEDDDDDDFQDPQAAGPNLGPALTPEVEQS